MFETLVTHYMNKYLSEFIEKFQKKKLKINLLSGEVAIADLQLKTSALKQFDLPVGIVWGKLGSLHAKLKLSASLLKHPIVVTISDVYLLAVPADATPYDAEKMAAVLQETKQRLIEQLEEKLTKEEPDLEVDTQKTFFNVVNNLKVSINRIHIRFEQSSRGNMAIGVIFREISLRSADEHWGESQKAGSKEVARKLVGLDGFSLYWTCTAEKPMMITAKPDEEKLEAFRKLNEDQELQFIIKPINATGKCALNKRVVDHNGVLNKSRFEVEFGFGPIDLELSNLQYQSSLFLGSELAGMRLRAKFKPIRPKATVKGNAKAWWVFAFNASLETHRRRTIKPDFITDRRRMRILYVLLYSAILYEKDLDAAAKNQLAWAAQSWKRKLAVDDIAKLVTAVKLNTSQKKAKAIFSEYVELIECEPSVSAENIIFWRKEASDKSVALKAARKAMKAATSKSWFRKSKTNAERAEATTTVVSEEAKVAEDERQEFLRALQEPDLGFMNPDSVKWRMFDVKLGIKRVGVVLKEKKQSANGRNYYVPILDLAFTDAALRLWLRPNADNAIGGTFNVGGLDLQVVRHSAKLESIVTPVASKIAHAHGRSVLSIAFEQQPIVREGEFAPDMSLKLETLPMEVFVSVPGIQRIGRFVENIGDTDLSELKNIANAKVEENRIIATKAGLLYLTEQRQSIDLRIILEAPILIVPAKDNNKSATLALVFDFGVLKISSVINNAIDNRNVEDVSMEELAYDDFNVELTQVQVLLARLDDNWREALLSHEQSRLSLLQNTSIKVLLKSCLEQYSTERPQFRVQGAVPQIKVEVSSLQLKRLNSFQTDFQAQLASSATSQTTSHAHHSLATSSAHPKSNAKKTLTKHQVLHEESLNQKIRERRMYLVLQRLVDVDLELHEVSLVFGYDSGSLYLPMLRACVSGLRLRVETRKWDHAVQFSITAIEVVSLLGNDIDAQVPILVAKQTSKLTQKRAREFMQSAENVETVGMVETAQTVEPETVEIFGQVSAKICDPHSPLFVEEYGSTAINVAITMRTVVIEADQVAMCKLLSMTQQLLRQLSQDVVSVTKQVAAHTVEDKQAPKTKPTSADVTDTVSTSAPSSTSDVITEFKVVFTFDELQIRCRDSDRLLLQLSVPNLKANLATKSDGDLTLHADLGGLSLEDLTADANFNHHRLIVSIESFHVDVLNFGQRKNDLDGFIGATGGKIRFIFLMYYVSLINNFIDPIVNAGVNVSRHVAKVRKIYVSTLIEISMQQKAPQEIFSDEVIEARVNATSQLLQSLPDVPDIADDDNLRQKCSKRKLDINLAAPLIMLPINRSSIKALGLDLGSLSVSNVFVETEHGVQDRMTISLDLVQGGVVTISDIGGFDYDIERKVFWMDGATCAVERLVECSEGMWAPTTPLALIVDLTTQPIQIELTREDILNVLIMIQGNMETAVQQTTTTSTRANNTRAMSPSRDLRYGDSDINFDDPSVTLRKSDSSSSTFSIFGATNYQIAYNHVLASNFSTNGIKVSASVPMIVAKLGRDDPTAQTSFVDFAMVKVEGVCVDYVNDERGLGIHTCAGVVLQTAVVSLEALTIIDMRDVNTGGVERRILGAANAKSLTKNKTPPSPIFTRRQQQTTSVLRLEYKGCAKAIQVVGHARQEFDAGVVPFDHHVLTNVFSRFGEVRNVFDGGNEVKRTQAASITFSEPIGLSKMMTHSHNNPQTYSDYFHRINWDPEATHTEVSLALKPLEWDVVVEFLVASATFIDVKAIAAVAAEMEVVRRDNNDANSDSDIDDDDVDDSVNGDLILPTQVVIQEKPRICSILKSPFPTPVMDIKLIMQPQKFIVLEKVESASEMSNTQRIECTVAISLQYLKEAGVSLIIATAKKLSIESYRFGDRYTVVPNLDGARVHIKQSGGEIDTGSGADGGDNGTKAKTSVDVSVSEVYVTASIQDVQFLMKLAQVCTEGLAPTAEDVRWDTQVVRWRPRRSQTTKATTGVEDDVEEVARIDINLVNFELNDSSSFHRAPLLAATASAHCTLEQWSSRLVVVGGATVAVSAYNASQGTWESVLLGTAPNATHSIAPVELELAVGSPQTRWIPAPGNHTIKCVHQNSSSTKHGKLMLDMDDQTFWDAGSTGINYVVFDFGTPVQILSFKYSCINSGPHAPYMCELLVSDNAETKGKKWKSIKHFDGVQPTSSTNNSSGTSVTSRQPTISHTVEVANPQRGRYLKWLIRKRYGKGAARITAAAFEVSGGGNIASLTCVNAIEVSLCSSTLQSLLKIGQLSATPTLAPGEMKRLNSMDQTLKSETSQNIEGESIGVAHQIINRTGFPLLALQPPDENSTAGEAKELGVGDKVTLRLFSKDTHATEVRSRRIKGLHVNPEQYKALFYLVSRSELGTELFVEIEGWKPTQVVITSMASVQYLTLEPRWKPSKVRLAVAVTLSNHVRRITLSSPCLFRNLTDLPLELSYKISRTTDSVDLRVNPGEHKSFPLGLMENIVADKCIPLFRFMSKNVRFYTTDVLDAQYLTGLEWEAEIIVGFIYHNEADIVNENLGTPLELWGCTPTKDRMVAELTAIPPGRSVREGLENKGMRKLGYVFQYQQELAKRPELVGVANVNGYNSFNRFFEPVEKKGDFLLLRSPGMLRVRTNAQFSWSKERFFSRQVQQEANVHMLTSNYQSDTAGERPMTFAIRHGNFAATWDLCSLFAVMNSLPYPILCALSPSKTAAATPSPDEVIVVGPGQTVNMPYRYPTETGGVSLRMTFVGHENEWTPGVEVASFGKATPLNLNGTKNPADVSVSIVQSGITYQMLLKAERRYSNNGALSKIEVYCPYVIHNETDLDLNIIAPRKHGPISSVWRPLGLTSSAPGLFSPHVLEKVVFLLPGVASVPTDLYVANEAVSISMGVAPLTTLAKSQNESLQHLLAQSMTSIGNTQDQIVWHDNTVAVTSVAYWNNRTYVQWKNIFIKPSVIVRNCTNVPMTVLHRPKESRTTFSLKNVSTNLFLDCGGAVLNVNHRQTEVRGASTLNATDGVWEIVRHEIDRSLRKVKLSQDVLDNGNVVMYGAKVNIEHATLKQKLHSHTAKWTKGSGNQQATCWKANDVNDWWLILPQTDEGGDRLGEPVCNGDVIRIMHGTTQQFLFTGLAHAAPTSKNDYNEVGCVAQADHRCSWVVACAGKWLQWQDSTPIVNKSEKLLNFGNPVPATMFEAGTRIEPGASSSIHADGKSENFYFQSDSGAESTAFSPTVEITNPVIRMPVHGGQHNEGFIAYQLRIVKTATTSNVSIHQPKPKPQYRFENLCDNLDLYIYQKNTSKSPMIKLTPGHMVKWCLDEASVVDVILRVMVDDGINVCTFDVDINQTTARKDAMKRVGGEFYTFPEATHTQLQPLVHTVAYTEKATDTRVFVWSQQEEKVRTSLGLPLMLPDEAFLITARVDFPAIGISVVDSAPKHGGIPLELLYARAANIDIGMTVSTRFKMYSANVKAIQIDHTADRDTNVPVLLSRRGGDLATPFIQLLTVIERGQVGHETISSVDEFKYIGAAIDKMDITCDVAVVAKLINFASQLESDTDDKNIETKTVVKVQPKLSFKEVYIKKINAVITLTMETQQDLPTWMRNVLGSTVIDGLAVTLRKVVVLDRNLTFVELADELTAEYLGQAAHISSIVFKGILNVVGIGTHIKNITDLAEPDEYDSSELRSADNFGSKFVGGTATVVGGTVAIPLGVVTKVVGGIGTLVGAATFDADYQQQRRKDMNKNVGVASGLATGVTRFGRGLFEGVTGIVTAPIKEAKKDGAVGALRGVGMGLIGLPMKIVGGTVDMVSSTTAGIEAELTRSKNRPKLLRCRDIRTVNALGFVPPYSAKQADGAAFLHKHFPDMLTQYIDHLVDPTGWMFFLLKNRLMTVKMEHNKKPFEVMEGRIGFGQIRNCDRDLQSMSGGGGGVLLTFVDNTTKMLSCSFQTVDALIEMIRGACSACNAKNTSTIAKGLTYHFPSPDQSSLQRGLSVRVKAPVIEQFVLWEWERHYPFTGWSKDLLPTDPHGIRGVWVEEKSGASHSKMEHVSPPHGYEWTGTWRHSNWEYALDWGSRFTNKNTFMDHVRKRSLTRSIKKIYFEKVSGSLIDGRQAYG
eukprot:m.254751 g.254751  ORF g.254751 m.254751 type:complete len:4107 (-) comp33921_c1_seq1:79-12399(-)